MTVTPSARPRRSKALPRGITALILYTLPMLMLPVMFAVANPYLAVPVVGLFDAASVTFAVTAVIVSIRGRTATVPLRFALTGASALLLAGMQSMRAFGFTTSIAGV